MNRQQKRKYKREFEKDIQVINKLTPQQAKVFSIAVKETKEDFKFKIDKALSAALIEKGWEWYKIEQLQRRMTELLLDDAKKIKKLEKENIDIMKIQEDVRKAIEECLEKGTNKKDAIKDLMFKFPKLSKSMLLNAYGKIKEEKKITRGMLIESAKKYGLSTEGKKKIAEELHATYSTISTYVSRWKITDKDLKAKDEVEVEEATNKIMDIIDPQEQEIAVKDAGSKEDKEKILKYSKKYFKEEHKEDKMEGLKILEEKVVKSIKVEGKNGIYEGKTGEGVVLSKDNATISFSSIEELEEWEKEYKQVLQMV